MIKIIVFVINCACKKAKLTISARIHLSKMSQPVQNDSNGTVRLFENSDIQIIEINRNYFSLNSAFLRIHPTKQNAQTQIDEKGSLF